MIVSNLKHFLSVRKCTKANRIKLFIGAAFLSDLLAWRVAWRMAWQMAWLG
jgi:hypothetical protein